MMTFGMSYTLRRNTTRAYALGAVIFTLAICSMHFTGMSAVVYRFNPLVSLPDAVMAPEMLAVAVAASAVLIVVLGLIGAMVDSHLESRAEIESRRLRAHIVELEATKNALEHTSQQLTVALGEASAATRAKWGFRGAWTKGWRTPLNAVLGFSEMLSTEVFGPTASPKSRAPHSGACAAHGSWPPETPTLRG